MLFMLCIFKKKSLESFMEPDRRIKQIKQLLSEIEKCHLDEESTVFALNNQYLLPCTKIIAKYQFL